MSEKQPAPRRNRTIVIPSVQEEYLETVGSPELFRKTLDRLIGLHPELFPGEIGNGYLMKELRVSLKTGLPVRRITVGSAYYTVRPAFVT
ncbi:MAG: hypothetical protein D3920_06540, partial [Candidatus Electrothrix sp. AW2]|nr:hypothetical protein [Candidatus Electrothrix gigas]